MSIVIHHNPDCGTSRNVLAIIEAVGYTPTVIEYLKTGWTRPQLLGLFAAAELGLLDPAVTDDALLDAMIAHPVLVNRPIVCTMRGVRLCRLSEVVLDLLERLPPGPVYKEDGTMLIDVAGNRLDLAGGASKSL